MNHVVPKDPMVLTALLTAKPEKHREFHQTLFSLLGGIQGQPGCLECRAGQDLGGESRFHLHLVWKDRQALEAFMGAEVFRILLGALQVLAVATEFRIVAAAEALMPGRPGQVLSDLEIKPLETMPSPP